MKNKSFQSFETANFVSELTMPRSFAKESFTQSLHEKQFKKLCDAAKINYHFELVRSSNTKCVLKIHFRIIFLIKFILWLHELIASPRMDLDDKLSKEKIIQF